MILYIVLGIELAVHTALRGLLEEAVFAGSGVWWSYVDTVHWLQLIAIGTVISLGSFMVLISGIV